MGTRFAFTLAAVSSLLVMSGCAYMEDREDQNYPVGARVPAEFINASGTPTGTALLTQTEHGVLIDVELRDLEPGWHAFHVHERGECDTPDFESAGGHYNPDDKEHGFEARGGYHAGDFPNIMITDSGAARFQVFSKHLSLNERDNPLFDSDGSALVVHSGQDNYRSQPSGNAGERVACAVIGR